MRTFTREYRRHEAREWGRGNLKGCVNVVIPSFTDDLTNVNEAAVRHDIRRCIELGFTGTLLVSEVNITLEEYRTFFEIANDESAGDLMLVHHGSWNNLEQNIEAVKIAEDNGAELALISYPPNFYPETQQDIYDYTRAVADATDLAVMLFPMNLWGFAPRIHQSDIPVPLLRRLIDDCPNVAAIKAEGGFPSIMGPIEAYRHFHNDVVISCPIEADMIPLAQLMPIQFSATSDTEFYGASIPTIFNHLQAGNHDEATRLFWDMMPARKAKQAVAPALSGGFTINRMAWKFQAWLQGFNGGPLRQPTMRIHDTQMNILRNGLRDCGLLPREEPNRDFFIGRNPSHAAPAAVARSA
jgi:4-hydroxy-tetrahydrodipicolinate synthase